MSNSLHPLYEESNELGRALFEDRKESEKAKGVPFGMQLARAGEWRKRVEGSVEFRRQELERFKKEHGERLGATAFLKKWKGRK